MRKILLFDVDGTLAESGMALEEEMRFMLKTCTENGYEVGIVGGGTLEKIIWQMGDALSTVTHFFSECGCVYHVNMSNKLCLVRKKQLRKHHMYNSINLLIKTALQYISYVDYTITGHFIDLRSGIVYISLIGMDATPEERTRFLDEDKKKHHIENLFNCLRQQSTDMGTDELIDIVRGGSVGITIYPSEWDKEQVLSYFPEDADIYYLGDKYETDGNDYRLLHHPRTKGYKTDSPEMTIDILHEILELESC